MKHILVTNDDGFESKGLHALVEALKPLAKVTVVAPTMEKSACGHSLTLTRPLRFIELDDDFFKLDDGTPTDCVFLSLNKLFAEDHKPDLVISGINKGSNMGEDITYSGTASAAMEAVLQGIPAIAISQVCIDKCQNIDDMGYDLAQQSIAALVKRIFEGKFPLPERKFLNVNIPPIKAEACQGFKVTRAGKRAYGNDAHVHWNPRGHEYYWIGLPRLDWHLTEGHITDFEAIRQNYISVTPVHLDMTSHDDIAALEAWL
ncbi:5'/3'-nucleotidase SurE [Sulfurovum sp.]|jgi:5'-nucleotidase|uniref:5'/3'-nucleotidase SurE n=1 Tax=Sulfurovum sp. TaxID=1969726 RepID=UPI002A35BA31|nr:5'/3'-nucleotidase SurE [Sulfurovum sp.]MDD2452188.1 5'/3'-nucleotidase SurE [Sulfurovum sp.]MDD3500575.1 5'/3'-nucleotidase SurE [Sulfurovum sp.]MDY0403506.1 5'/3'-nucleotidase SurE [Sulfurovum sp.]